ncbi:FecR domain-containing protein [Fulvivirgaceae bacterium PWU5]|uniref:FecR domain-containing protein n=1 Tax=Dawidia cretensis TaxID=2782350 RepID=A0AAP2DW24_9BACT|nr:FecR family protein [Dawidia cretensis]MBT1708430.1 FecR domain-containing protein [Dawidia cretensis]
MDHKNLTVEDLASNESFIDWVKQSDPEAVKYWDLYISTHPEIKEKVDKARTLVLNLKAAEEIDYDGAQVDSMWAKIQNRVEAKTEPSHQRTVSKMTWAVVLASVLLLSASVVFWFESRLVVNDQHPSAYNQQGDDFIERINETDQPLEVQLEDGSTIVLESKSKLKYKKDFLNDSSRQVYMFGKAFFKVTKNPYKPFIVHSNEIVVKVLGTSFRVESPENGENILVSVKTGKVSVSAPTDVIKNNKQGGVILLPNQQVTYERKNRQFEKTLIESPEFLGATGIAPRDFVFDNVPIARAFQTIESAYGVEIIFNEEVMKNCYITAPLGSESLRDKLKIICETIGASYEIIDANVVINSAGCQ